MQMTMSMRRKRTFKHRLKFLNFEVLLCCNTKTKAGCSDYLFFFYGRVTRCIRDVEPAASVDNVHRWRTPHRSSLFSKSTTVTCAARTSATQVVNQTSFYS